MSRGFFVFFTFKCSVPHAIGDLCSVLLGEAVPDGFVQRQGVQQQCIMEPFHEHVDLEGETTDRNIRITIIHEDRDETNE